MIVLTKHFALKTLRTLNIALQPIITLTILPLAIMIFTDVNIPLSITLYFSQYILDYLVS